MIMRGGYVFILSAIATGLATFFGLILRHPIIVKMMIFTTFTGLLTYSFSFIKALVTPHIVNNTLLSLLAHFGILDGISLYLTIIVSGFFMKQVLHFISST